MAGIARGLNVLIVDETILRIDVCHVAGVASDARSGVGIGGLPTRQEFVPVIVPAFALTAARGTGNRHLRFGREATLNDILMALQAVLIADREVDDRRLDGSARKPLEGIARAHQFGLHAARNPWPGMTIDAQRTLGGVIRSQVNR